MSRKIYVRIKAYNATASYFKSKDPAPEIRQCTVMPLRACGKSQYRTIVSVDTPKIKCG